MTIKTFRACTMLLVGLGMGLAGTPLARGQIAGGEIRSDIVPYNLTSRAGVPISTTTNSPPGSNGKAPTALQQSNKGLTQAPPTAGQFQSFVAFGGGVQSRVASAIQTLAPFQRGGNAPFIDQTSQAEPGVITYRSGAINNSQISTMDVLVTGPGELSFWWKVSSEARYDYLQFWIQSPGTLGTWSFNRQIHGEFGWHKVSVPLGAGTHTLRWQYIKDYIYSAGQDAGWVNRIEFKPQNATFGVPVYPTVTNGSNVILMKQARIGAPYLAKSIQFNFGSVIPIPEVDETGAPLAGPPSEYWAAEPHWPSNLKENGEHTGAPYYWSRHARSVFVNSAGQIEVAWRRLAPIPGADPNAQQYQNANYAVIPPFVYPLMRMTYSASSSPAKSTRRFYWTEGSFQNTGLAVSVPDGLILSFAYNGLFPKRVSQMYSDPGDSPRSTNSIEELRTIFFDSETSTIRAYNHQGRILVELLGDTLEGDRRQHLGIEIIDVVRRVNPELVVVELGDKVTAWQDGKFDDSELTPVSPISQLQSSYLYEHHKEGSRVQLYAIRETTGLNDVLLHWVEQGLQGLYWPYRFTRNTFIWPSSMARYNHYLRPAATSRQEAALSAVAMPLDNVPLLTYQDTLDQPRAFFTESMEFYTWLTPQYPVHRTLLRFMSGDNVAFERVFSWLQDDLYTGTNGMLYATGNVARVMGGFLSVPNFGTNAVFVPDLTGFDRMLEEWDPYTGRFDLSSPFVGPRVVNETVYVGQRLQAPLGDREPLPGAPYWAGHIRQDKGTSYHPGAYIDPITAGFTAANLSSIIPVNVIPGSNKLEVWWYRSNAPDLSAGFERIYWPSVVGRYTIAWPVSPREIVLASNDGSGPLMSLEANGVIYYNNTPGTIGYNPNEEHALMIGGQAYALRDDLNVTTPGPDFTSDRYVLLDFTGSDGRPDMAVFKVMREKPEAGQVFDYIVEAGTILQAPMPLPLMAPPTEPSGLSVLNYNTEIALPGTRDLPGGWSSNVHANSEFGHYPSFTFRDRKEGYWVYRGLNSGEPALQAGTYRANDRLFVSAETGVAVAGVPFRYVLHTSQREEALKLELISTNAPYWLLPDGVAFAGTPPANAVNSTNVLTYTLSSTIDNSTITQQWTLIVRSQDVGAGGVIAQGPLAITSTNVLSGTVVQHIGRPPYLAINPAASNSFAMRFYYKTQEGFAWPGTSTPVPVGSIVPYLRPLSNSTYVGQADAKETVSLDIVYRPVWPVSTPGMRLGDTLTTPKEGLPAVRGQTSLQILYQQSVASNLVNRRDSVVLHDSTREKEADLLALDGVFRLPGSIRTDLYMGRVYFPNLPPHLAERVFFDPNRGANGKLVLRGDFREEILKPDYLMLNVLAGSDLQAVLDLCPETDSAGRAVWGSMVSNLSTRVETFVPSAAVPGTYVPSLATNGVLAARNIGVGAIAEIKHHDTAVDSYALSASGPGIGYVTLIAGGGSAFTDAGDPVSVHIIRVEPVQYPGVLKVVQAPNPLNESLTFQHTPDLGGRFNEYEYDWRIAAPVNGLPPAIDESMSQWVQAQDVNLDLPRFVLGGASIRTLSDNYVTVRYRPKNTTHPLYNQWSEWTSPMLAEGWIKRVLAGINPFRQRVTDLFNNPISSDVSMLTQAGPRWEGDIALNLANINNFGLIEIYETVLNRGRMLSIDAGINYGPANDALLLAAGYLNDLYRFVGDEAFADAANPTIGIGTADRTYGDIATAMFAFSGQTPTLLEEELALLRGRDDFLLPGTKTAPVYNRLVWNYTRGIAAGEVIYALNYNIKEKPDDTMTGVIGAEDAAHMYPQGHGDAYGHYLTAGKNYLGLFMNPNFTWVPRIEAVLLLGQPVSVDYFDERKFAASAVAWSRTAQQVFDLTWRRDYQGGVTKGWKHFGESRKNNNTNRERYWGLDHWSTRAGLGTYVQWAVANAILPANELDPDNEGIQKIDRTTVTELRELPIIMDALQTSLSSAEAGLTPLGLAQDGIAFDISPTELAQGKTHFEQVVDRAIGALNNAVIAFDDAKDVTRMMRMEEDSLSELQDMINKEEFAYETRLIEIYGTPYPDDVGPGKTYPTGYDGPDFMHYAYVELPALERNWGQWMTTEPNTWKISVQQLPDDWLRKLYRTPSFFTPGDGNDLMNGEHYIEYTIQPHGFFGKPPEWKSSRRAPGELQQLISEYIAAHYDVVLAVNGAQDARKWVIKNFDLLLSSQSTDSKVEKLQRDLLIAREVLEKVQFANKIWEAIGTAKDEAVKEAKDAVKEAIPNNFIAGLAAGGDLTSVARAAVESVAVAQGVAWDVIKVVRNGIIDAYEMAVNMSDRWVNFADIDYGIVQTQGYYEQVAAVAEGLDSLNGNLEQINIALRKFDDAKRKLAAKQAEGDRLLEERMIFRQRTAGLVQGYRTRDAAFRLFRNEKLERYKTLFDLSARYAFMAAQAYDYETGLLGTDQGKSFIDRIINARALGVVQNGQPQFAGSNTGDPGLSSVLAEMLADWSVLRGRLGFNNPDGYGTTVSLRQQRFRIPSGAAGDATWRDTLQSYWRANILEDVDVRTHAMQADADGLAIPGLIIPFQTTIAPGRNLFGLPLMGGDAAYSASSFATKIYAAGVALQGYIGMNDPASNSGVVDYSGGTSPVDPLPIWSNPDALASTPYIYLIPTGVDSMRSPPLGDTSTIRTWSVKDVTIPLPFNIGASQFSTLQWWQSSDFLTEDLFSVRKHQAFRPVSHPSVFGYDIYGSGGYLQPSPFTNSRLIGRSVWNSQWKLIIPGNTLLYDSEEGLRRLLRTLDDIHLHFVTYSYSGN